VQNGSQTGRARRTAPASNGSGSPSENRYNAAMMPLDGEGSLPSPV
jgi:hypothetical protein